MNFRPIEAKDKEIYEAHYRAASRMASDASFTTPFVWSKSFGTSIFYENDVLCLMGVNPKGTPYFMMPVGAGDKVSFLQKLAAYAKEAAIPFSIHWILEAELPLIGEAFGETYPIVSSRNSAEYIYHTESLLTLSGKKLHAKRNHVNGFKAAYTYETASITEDNLAQAEAFVLARCNSEEEYVAMQKLFANYFFLGLSGMLLYADGTLAAVTAGEKITEDTALIHLEKADTSFKGAYPAVNQLFISQYFADTTFINREEDMGIEGLRRAKLSYAPAFLLEKFTLKEAL